MTAQQPLKPSPATTGAAKQPSAARSVRRVYVYAVAAATLLITAIGAVLLLGLGLDKLFTAISGAEWTHGGPDWERQRLSISVPLIVIAAPIWWLHWRMAQRALRGPDGDAERHSLARNLYFAAVFFISGLWVAMNVVSNLQLALVRAFGGDLDQMQRGSVVTAAAIFIVAVAVWAFHVLTYFRAVPTMEVEQRSDVPVNIAFYVASAIGGIAALFGVLDLIRLGLRAALNENGPDRWWREPLSNAVALTVTFGVVWAVNWLCAARLTATSAWWGRGPAGATIRRIYLVAVPVVTGAVALIYAAQGVEALTKLAFDVPVHFGDARAFTILNPLLGAVPFAVVWMVHRYLFNREPEQAGDRITPVTAARLFDYVMSALGLLMASAGLALLIGELVKRLASLGDWQANAGWPLGLAIGAGALWAWYWARTLARFRRDPEAEQSSTIRRAYLFVVLGGSLVALVVGLAMTVYQVLQKVLDVAGTGPLAGGIALPLGISIVTALVAAYHVVLLRRDLRVRGLIEREEQAGIARMELVLTGPVGADLNKVVAHFRRGLPAGYAIETQSTGPEEAPRPPEIPPMIDRPIHAV